MSNFQSGVKEYITGECTVKVHFPVDWNGNASVCCYQCKFYSRAGGGCRLTQEISEYPQKYVGSCCPLEFKENDKGETEDE